MKIKYKFLILIFCPFIIRGQINNTQLQKDKKVNYSQFQSFPNSKIQPLNRSQRQKKSDDFLLKSFKFNGKNITYQNTSTKVSSNRRTVRNGRTLEVKQYDGTSGTTESTSNNSTSKIEGANCTSQQVTLEAGFNELNILDPSGVEIYPGRILDISTMDEGSYSSFTNFTSRNDLKIALISAGVSENSIVRTVSANNISQGTVRDQYNDILRNFGSNSFGSQTIMMESFEYFNDEQFSIEAGLGIQAPALELALSANAGYSQSVKKNKIILKYLRDAFTVKVDNDINQLVVAENLSIDAGVIASVNYGSWGIVTIESDSSFNSMNAALQAAFRLDPTTSITGNMTAAQKKVLSNMSIKAIFKGIDGNQNWRTNLTIDEVRKILTNEVDDFSATTPVVPISFTVKSLKTGETMMLRSTMTYSRKECIPITGSGGPKNIRVRLIGFSCPGVNDGFSGDEDIFGKINISYRDSNNVKKNVEVWNVSMQKNVKVGQSNGPPGSEGGSKAYSLVGAPSVKELSFIINEDNPDSLASKELEVTLDLKDEELIGGPYQYEKRKFLIKYSHILLLLNGPKKGISDLYDDKNKMYRLEATEVGNTNKIVLWLQIEPN